MRIAIVGGVLLLVGVAAAVFGVLPPEAVAELAGRVLPILAFVVAVTVVAELASEAGVFRVLAERLAAMARGRAIVLWLLVLVLATASTVFLSLDTTAVLLTPVVVALAAHARISPIPFALTTVWIANTGSLLLPVSNLTNLLAAEHLGLHPLQFAAITAAPALVAVLVTAVVLFATRPRQLLARFEPEQAGPPDDPVLFRIAAITLAALVPLLVSGLEVWIPASVAAAVLVVAFAVRRPGVLTGSLVPWQLVVFASGLFLSVEALHAARATDVLAALAGTGEGPLELLRLAGVGAASANLVNNLPAYLALEPFADDPVRLVALLIGVNAGAIITPWGSLATLLWHQRLVSMGVEISWPRFMLLGLLLAPLVVVAATLALAATS
ncbi:arsenite efflux membrane protein ArsB [Agromyces sp. CF514]|uniref:SLC13 family permease n=1 Tax=Agromyces sp. CF514 TaxID=1881031 RepID=UPI0008E7AB1A|nr:SLC13 family permease [Agromyces sp. CF514]SFR68424.1 arsenite efflux membrane protein ArsB [Agromyces sp. CF514]